VKINLKVGKLGKLFHSDLLENLFLNCDWESIEYRSQLFMEIEYPEFNSKMQYSLNEIISILKSADDFKVFIDAMNSLDYSILYKSRVHGISHVERAALHAFFLCHNEGFDEYEKMLCMECIKYHDIGRLGDNEDPLHGIIGSKKYVHDAVHSNLSRREIEIVSFVIASHCLDENNAVKLLKHYFYISPDDYELCRKLLFTVKDADALDRFRLSAHSLNTGLLKTGTSQSMIQGAYELYFFSHQYEKS